MPTIPALLKAIARYDSMGYQLDDKVIDEILLDATPCGKGWEGTKPPGCKRPGKSDPGKTTQKSAEQKKAGPPASTKATAQQRKPPFPLPPPPPPTKFKDADAKKPESSKPSGTPAAQQRKPPFPLPPPPPPNKSIKEPAKKPDTPGASGKRPNIKQLFDTADIAPDDAISIAKEWGKDPSAQKALKLNKLIQAEVIAESDLSTAQYRGSRKDVANARQNLKQAKQDVEKGVTELGISRNAGTAPSIVSNIETSAKYKEGSFSVVRDKKGKPQAMLQYKEAEGVESLFIANLVTAPWNSSNDPHPNKMRGAGTAAIAHAIKVSEKKGYGGKVELMALREAVPFYKKLGFTITASGPSGDAPFMELSPKKAKELLKALEDANEK